MNRFDVIKFSIASNFQCRLTCNSAYDLFKTRRVGIVEDRMSSYFVCFWSTFNLFMWKDSIVRGNIFMLLAIFIPFHPAFSLPRTSYATSFLIEISSVAPLLIIIYTHYSKNYLMASYDRTNERRAESRERSRTKFLMCLSDFNHKIDIYYTLMSRMCAWATFSSSQNIWFRQITYDKYFLLMNDIKERKKIYETFVGLCGGSWRFTASQYFVGTSNERKRKTFSFLSSNNL